MYRARAYLPACCALVWQLAHVAVGTPATAKRAGYHAWVKGGIARVLYGVLE